uniref:Uncharacterized protein n=1 Tax=Helianthus annuus TaxID=4232 RepID=A0A251UDC6_HELAN
MKSFDFLYSCSIHWFPFLAFPVHRRNKSRTIPLLQNQQLLRHRDLHRRPTLAATAHLPLNSLTLRYRDLGRTTGRVIKTYRANRGR